MLVLVTNRRIGGTCFLDRLEEAVSGGVDRVILREKDLEPEDLVILGREVKRRIQPWGASLFINSDLQTALGTWEQIGAEGIHLTLSDYELYTQPQEAKPGSAGVEGVGRTQSIRVGVSVHSEMEVRSIVAGQKNLQPEYFLAGHIFQTDCKKDLPGRGLAFLQSVRKAAGAIPVVAIGGIGAENAGDVVAAGADGIAVMSGFMKSGGKELARRIRLALNGGHGKVD